MIEYGIFNDEGCLETGIYSLDEAKSAIAERHSEDQHACALILCPAGHEAAKGFCPDCDADDY